MGKSCRKCRYIAPIGPRGYEPECPKCGTPYPPEPQVEAVDVPLMRADLVPPVAHRAMILGRSITRRAALVYAALIVVASVFAVLILGQPHAPQAAKSAQYLAVLLYELSDPDSAKTRNLRFVQGDGGEALCGEVNWKNQYGGYTGFKAFVVTERKMKDVASRVIIFRGDPNDLENKRVMYTDLAEDAKRYEIRSAGCKTPVAQSGGGQQ